MVTLAEPCAPMIPVPSISLDVEGGEADVGGDRRRFRQKVIASKR
jgi:hypothetical protein